MKKNLRILIILMLSISLIGCQGVGSGSVERDKYEIYLACDSQQDTVTFLYLQEFARLLEEKSNGKMKTYLYPNSQIGGDLELIDAIQNGNITFVVQTTAPQVNFIPEASIMDLPNSFVNKEVAREVLSGPFFHEMQKIYEKYGFRLYGMADQDFRIMSSNVKIGSIDNFAGIKIRTMENPNHLAYWKALKANPTPMNFGEVYVGLQQKMIDAQENPIETIVSAKLYEQQDYLVRTNHVLHTLTLVGSPKIIDRMPQDLQVVIVDAANEATDWARSKTDERAESRLKIIEESGTEIIELPPEMLLEMRERSSEVEEIVSKKTGEALIKLFYEEVDKANAKYGIK